VEHVFVSFIDNETYNSLEIHKFNLDFQKFYGKIVRFLILNIQHSLRMFFARNV
jgi:hypothetical protein